MNLYTDSKNAKLFSDTRTFPWRGWYYLLQYFDNKKKSISILDVGCGNGRFFKFITNKLCNNITTYVGLDYSETLLSLAKDFIQDKGILLLIDLESDNWDSNLRFKDFDFVVVFGVMHHISKFEKRKSLVHKCVNLLSDDGYLIISWWKFLEFSKYSKKIIKEVNFTFEESHEDFDKNNYLLSFGSSSSRFCHFCTDEEIHILSQHKNLKLIDKYRSDGQDNLENLYTILKKVK